MPTNKNGDNIFPVMEIFGPTIQGEGAMIGRLTHFVRFGGCSYRCSWCDSMHAVDPQLIHKHAIEMTAEQIADKVVALGSAQRNARWVTLSGGDPAIWDQLELIMLLHDRGFKVAIETQGAVFPESWIRFIDHITVSPKPPSSGMSDRTDYKTLSKYDPHNLRQDVCFKVVVFDDADLKFALGLHHSFRRVPFYLSVGTSRPLSQEAGDLKSTREEILDSYLKLVEKVIEQAASGDITILPQQHALLWGHKQGV